MDDMKLPEGKTCSDCRSWARCKKFIGSLTGKETTCDWAPSRFEESNESLMKQIESQKEEIKELREACTEIIAAHNKRGAALTAACGDNQAVIKARLALAKEGESHE